MAYISQIKLPDGTVYDIKDATGGSGGSISIDNALKASSNNAVTNKAIYNALYPSYPDGLKLGYLSKANGYGSIAIGSDSNASAEESTAVGSSSNANASGSMAVGRVAKAFGVNSVSLGYYATANNSYTIALGANADVNKSNSIAIGTAARTYGNNAVSLGAGAYARYDRSAALGYNAYASGSNSVALGHGSNAAYGAIAIGCNVCASANSVQLGGANITALYCAVTSISTSDRRDKTDIEELSQSLDFINALRPVTYVRNNREMYQYDEEELTEEELEKRHKYGLYGYDKEAHATGTLKGERRRVGLIAQEVRQAMIDSFGDSSCMNLIDDDLFNFENVPDDVEGRLGISYTNFIPVLIKAIQELTARIELLEGK